MSADLWANDRRVRSIAHIIANTRLFHGRGQRHQLCRRVDWRQQQRHDHKRLLGYADQRHHDWDRAGLRRPDGHRPDDGGIAGRAAQRLRQLGVGHGRRASIRISCGIIPTTPQPISGFAYSDMGVTPLASGAGGAHTVSVLADGTSLGSVTTGANGYYYVVAPAGTFSGSTALLAMSDGGTAGARLATGAEALAGDPDGDGDNAEGFDIWASTLIAPTSATTYSTASATTLQTQDASLIAQATGSDTAAQTLIAGLSRYGYIATDANGFTVDQSLTLSNGLYVQTTTGDHHGRQ